MFKVLEGVLPLSFSFLFLMFPYICVRPYCIMILVRLAFQIDLMIFEYRWTLLVLPVIT